MTDLEFMLALLLGLAILLILLMYQKIRFLKKENEADRNLHKAEVNLGRIDVAWDLYRISNKIRNLIQFHKDHDQEILQLSEEVSQQALHHMVDFSKITEGAPKGFKPLKQIKEENNL